MVFSLCSILVLNEKGITLMSRQREYRRASLYFREALSRLQAYMLGNPEDTEDGGQDQRNVTREPLFDLEGVPMKADIGDDVCSFLLFDRAISIRIESDSFFSNEIARSSIDHNVFSCSLLFNLALCFHLSGLQDGRESFLNRASRVYAVAISLLEDARQDNDTVRHFLELAVINNCGHLDYYFVRTQGAESCLNRMRQIIDEGTNGGQQSVPENYIFFFLNVLHNERQSIRSPPSA